MKNQVATKTPKRAKRVTDKDTREMRQAGSKANDVRATHSEDGVDLTLIRWMLTLTPAQRLESLQQTIRSIIKLREKNRT